MNIAFYVHIKMREIIYKNFLNEDNHELKKKFSQVRTMSYNYDILINIFKKLGSKLNKGGH